MISESLMHEAGHSKPELWDNPKGWGEEGGGGGVQDGGTHVHLWLIHVNVWQKPPQHCKAISLQLKLKNKESDTTELYVCIYMYILCIYI